MGHKKKQTLKLEQHYTGNRVANFSAPARNLRKTDLGSVIFGCKNATFKECVMKQLFGLPSPHFAYVRNVRPGMPLFLFNYTDRKLHGIYEAASDGQMEINRYAWTFESGELTSFPAQVRVKIRQQCRPLTEDQFKPIIQKNYYEHSLFWFELDKAQTHNLIASFLAQPVLQAQTSLQYTSLRPSSSCTTSLNSEKRQVSFSEAHRDDNPKKKLQAVVSHGPLRKQAEAFDSKKSWSSLFKQSAESKPSEEDEADPSIKCCNLPSEQKVDMDWESIYYPDEQNIPPEMEDHDRTENEGDKNVADSNEEFEQNSSDVPDAMHSYSNENSVDSGRSHEDGETTTTHSDNLSHQSNMEWGSSCPAEMQDPECVLSNDNNDFHDISSLADQDKNSSDTTNSTPLPSEVVELSGLTEEIIFNMTHSELRSVAVKLIHAMKRLNTSYSVQSQAIHPLKQELVQSGAQTRTVTQKCEMPQPSYWLPTGLVGEERTKKSSDSSLDCGHSMLLVGGFDGTAFLSALDSFSPGQDLITPLKPMNSVCSYAASAMLNDKVFILGGGDGKIWYDTVQLYNPRNDNWVRCPSLSKKKGSLVGICLDNNIFAIGGGNGADCLAEVEVLDLGIERWISRQPMLQKRFASGAAEMKGRIYVVGGYDGDDYLSSMEALDPREKRWTQLENMQTRRGSHSVTLLNEKLYAFGGYDGEKFVSSVEVFDPRRGSWMAAEPMNVARCYFGATTIGSSIYAIGGLTTGGDVLSTVERYSEANGWQMTGAKSVGKRSSFLAIALDG